mmetsp:Transcript_93659/g.270604  ORF Transcript_93659/g.270604 Transcript_93659/m.270604 type:complete len:222 (-) Transcript_93659:56-721(-)
MSISGSFDFVSSSLGLMHRNQSQFVKASGVKTPRKLSLLSLNATFTALQFFALSIFPWSSSSSASFPFALGGGSSLSSSSSSSALPAPPPASSVPSPFSSMATKSGSSSSSSSSPVCATPMALARSCIQMAKFLCVCRSSMGMALSMVCHSTAESEFVPETTILLTISSMAGSGSIIVFASILASSNSLPRRRASFLSSTMIECKTAAWICSSVKGRPPHF